MPIASDSMENEKNEIIYQQCVALNFLARHWVTTKKKDEEETNNNLPENEQDDVIEREEKKVLPEKERQEDQQRQQQQQQQQEQDKSSTTTTKQTNLNQLATLWNKNMTKNDRLPGVVYEFNMSENLPEKLTHWTRFPCFKKHREDEEQFQEFVENRGHISGQENYESLTQCFRCGKRKVVSSAKQTRSSDEPMTVTHFCINCSRSWTG